jgi:hypothetical protein
VVGAVGAVGLVGEMGVIAAAVGLTAAPEPEVGVFVQNENVGRGVGRGVGAPPVVGCATVG